jgi:hypothetical protein
MLGNGYLSAELVVHPKLSGPKRVLPTAFGCKPESKLPYKSVFGFRCQVSGVGITRHELRVARLTDFSFRVAFLIFNFAFRIPYWSF